MKTTMCATNGKDVLRISFVCHGHIQLRMPFRSATANVTDQASLATPA